MASEGEQAPEYIGPGERPVRAATISDGTEFDEAMIVLALSSQEEMKAARSVLKRSSEEGTEVYVSAEMLYRPPEDSDPEEYLLPEEVEPSTGVLLWTVYDEMEVDQKEGEWLITARVDAFYFTRAEGSATS